MDLYIDIGPWVTLTCPRYVRPTYEDIKPHIIIIIITELRNCVKVEVDVLGSHP